jgi:hypothetical protein
MLPARAVAVINPAEIRPRPRNVEVTATTFA